MQKPKRRIVVQYHPTMQQNMSPCIFPRLRNVHAIPSSTGRAFDLAHLVLVNDLLRDVLVIWFVLFWFHSIGIAMLFIVLNL